MHAFQLSVMVDVIGFSFKSYVLNTALSVRVYGARASMQLFFVHAFQLSVMVDVIPPLNVFCDFAELI